MKLRVLHVAKYYPPAAGGMERVVEMLCTVARDRLDSRVLAFSTSGETREDIVDGVRVTRLGTIGKAGSVPVSPALFGAIRAADADVMVLHEPNPWALLAYAVCRPRMPLVIWFHSEVVRPRLQYSLFYAPVARPAYASARRIVVSSARLGEHAEAIRFDPARIRVVPFGIDPGSWQPTPMIRARAAEIRRRLGAPIALFAGRLVPYKGVDVLLRAVAPLDVRTVVVGEGPMRDEWTTLAERLAARGVTFAGEVNDEELRAYMAACDFFVLPSVTRAEAFGYVQLEAMASGKPVVSTHLPSGVPWVNQHRTTGLVVPPGDAMALRDAIEQLAGDPALRTRLGEGGRRRVADEFTLEQMAERFVAVCREAAGLAGPNPPVETERREDSFIHDRRSRAEAPAVRAGATARARP
jgi:rhamnosyl/mannosyltransferase